MLVIGACRSGKSAYALKAAADMAVREKVFIATSVPADEEMRQRVARHRAERGRGWTTLEVPAALCEALGGHARPERVLLVDCLTLWITNLLMQGEASAAVEEHIGRLCEVLGTIAGPVILVSNEVGAGIVPENPLARVFRDLAGTANQAVAAVAGRVVLTVAGIPVVIK
jgi:adenosylcobinamide kinase/adenosylcobinamide-phosphate guanylyltransferase